MHTCATKQNAERARLSFLGMTKCFADASPVRRLKKQKSIHVPHFWVLEADNPFNPQPDPVVAVRTDPQHTEVSHHSRGPNGFLHFRLESWALRRLKKANSAFLLIRPLPRHIQNGLGWENIPKSDVLVVYPSENFLYGRAQFGSNFSPLFIP